MKISRFSLLVCLISYALLGQSAAVFADNLPKAIFLNHEKWTQAFLDMNQLMARQYALGQYKKINWNELKNKYYPIIDSAEKNKAKIAYYQAIRG